MVVPLYQPEAEGAQGAEHHEDEQLEVEGHDARVEEAAGGAEGLRELEQSEGRARIVGVHRAQHGVDLGVETSIAQPQQKTAQHCQN